MCEHLLRHDGPKRTVLGRWLPLCLPHRVGRGFYVRIRDDVYLQGVAAKRSERCRRAISGDDADRIRDWPQRFHDRLQRGAQGAIEPPWRLDGPGRR